MTVLSWPSSGVGTAPRLDGLLAGGALDDAALMTMAAPREVPTPLWALSSAGERRALIAGLPATVAGAAALSGGGAGASQVAIDVAALMRAAVSGVGPYAAIFARAGVLSLPLMLSGDTPQPKQQDLQFGDLTLRLTAPRVGAEIGAAGTRAEFRVDKPGWFHFAEGTRRLDVPVAVTNGQLRFDVRALEVAYGRPLPGAISQMARPATVTSIVRASPTTTNAARPCVLIDGTIVPVGQRAYQIHIVPPSKPHWPLTGDHMHMFTANQNPMSGKCFWVKEKDVYAPIPPSGSIPLKPFMP